MSNIFIKEEVLEFIKNNSDIKNKFFIKGDFSIFNENHLRVVHKINCRK